MADYMLCYEDRPLIRFSEDLSSALFVTRSRLPFSIKHEKDPVSAVRSFCSDRVLSMNRRYCKEVLLSCGIEDQSDIAVCLSGYGLSFCDHYWIRPMESDLSWIDVDLRRNEFSREVAYTGVTGELRTAVIGDGVYNL